MLSIIAGAEETSVNLTATSGSKEKKLIVLLEKIIFGGVRKSDIINKRIVTNYKQYVKTNGDESDEWQVVYANNENVYLMTKYQVKHPAAANVTQGLQLSTAISSRRLYKLCIDVI